MTLHDLTLQDVIRKNQVLRPGDIAFVDSDNSWTFDQFASDVERLASGLAARGLEKGDRIAVMAYNCYEFFVLLGAAAELGTIIVPINWRLNADEVAFILQDCTAETVVASRDFEGILAEISNRCPSVKERIVLGSSANSFRPLHEILSSAGSYEPVDITGKDPFVILYTAAVQGKSKGALLTHGNVMAAGLQVAGPMQMGPGDVYVNLLPLFHIMGFQLALGVYFSGGRNIIIDRFDALKAVSSIESERATVIGTVPPMLASILDQAEQTGRSLRSLRLVAGLFDSPETIVRCQETAGATFWSGFGQTETTGYITLAPYNERPGSSGREGPMVRMKIADDFDRDVAPGQPGEILIRGPVTFRQYWRLEEETSFTFRDGWHHTGDVGRLDEAGYLWYAGRKAEKELIKPGGENVYPVEVEKVILRHEGVAEVSVFGVPDREWGEAIKAVCVLKEGIQLRPEDLIEFVGSRIARYKKPKYVSFVHALPKLEDGSVDRVKVKAMEQHP